jgi:hypothetical protein
VVVVEWVSAAAAVAAAAFSGAAWVVAWRARRDSKRAADSSEVSAKAASESAETGRVEAARRVERRDVEWEFVEQPESEHWRIEYRNVGVTPAHQVEAALVIDGIRVDLHPGTIPPGQSFVHDAHHDYEEAMKRWEEGLAAGFVGSPGIQIDARILWTSDLGTPAIWTGTSHA